MTSPSRSEPLGGNKLLTGLLAVTRNAAIGASVAIAIWCTLLLLDVLPGFSSDTSGLLLFAMIGLFAGATRLRVLTLVLLQLVAALILAIALTPLSSYLARHWLRRDPVPSGSVDAVIALSAGLNADTTMSGEALDHLITALELVRAGQSRVLVTTTADVVFQRSGRVRSDEDQSRILGLFPGATEWLRTPVTTSTHDEAVESEDLLLPQGLTHVVVVTSPMHSRRACATFERAGFSVVCVPARLRGLGALPIPPTPRERLAIFGQLVYEWSAMAEYSIRGWVRTDKPRRSATNVSARRNEIGASASDRLE